MKDSGDNSAQSNNSRKPSFEQLESRLLLSADYLGAMGLQGYADPSQAVNSDVDPASEPTSVDDIIQLDGMHLVSADIQALAGQVIRLDFDGAQNVTYNGPIVVTGINISALIAPKALVGQEAAIAQAVTARLNDIFSPMGVTFELAGASDATDASTIYVGGAGGAFDMYGSFLGLAEQVDVGNTSHTDQGFVFSDLLTGGDFEGYVTGLTQLVAHETGHLLGYAHNENDGQDISPLAAVAASIEGKVWNDGDADGQMDPGEQALIGWTVQLNNGQTTVTDSNGNYRFSNLVAGTYTVSQDLPIGWIQTAPVSSDVLDYHGSDVLKSLAGGGIEVKQVATDADGNVYLAGLFNGQVDLDPTAGSDVKIAQGGQDIFVVKLNADGSYAWSGTWGGAGSETLGGLAVDQNGNVFVAGNFSNSADLDPTAGVNRVSAVGTQDAFLTKINADGTLGWTGVFAGANALTVIADITVDTNGDVFMTGSYTETVDFNPHSAATDLRTSPFYFPNQFVTCMRGNGSYGWTRVSQAQPHIINPVGRVEGKAIDVDENGFVYAAGWFENTIDFDPGVGRDLFYFKGDADIYVLKLDTNGNYYSTWQIAGSEEDRVYDIDADATYGVTITGSFSGWVDFDPTNGTDHKNREPKIEGWFVTRMNADGTYAWTQVWDVNDGASVSVGTGVAVDAVGNTWVAVHQPTSGASDAQLVRLDAGGRITSATAWNVQDTGTFAEMWDVEVGPGGSILFAGRYAGNADLDPTTGADARQTAGLYDGFVSRLGAEAAVRTVTVGSNQTVTNIDFGTKPSNQSSSNPSVLQFTASDQSQGVVGMTDNRIVAVSIQAADVGGSIVRWMITESGSPDGTWSNVAPATYELSAGAGVKTLYAWVLDNQGNMNQLTPSSQTTITFDNTAPVVTLNPGGTVTVGSPMLTGTVDDPSAIVRVIVNNLTFVATNNHDGTWTLPQGTIAPGLPTGTYNVQATATDLLGRATAAAPTTLIVSVTDLGVTSVNVNSSMVQAGDSFVLSLNIQELAGKATGDFRVEARLSTDGQWDSGDIVLTPSQTHPGLTGYGVSFFEMTVTVPVAAPAGHYYVLVKVDADNVVDERSETNNVAQTNGLVLEVTVPDLTAPSLTRWQVGRDTGNNTTDHLTSDTTPRIILTFDEVVNGIDSDIRILDPNNDILNPAFMTITGWGTDEVMAVLGLPIMNGVYTVVVKGTISDLAGNAFNHGTDEHLTFEVDTVGPIATISTAGVAELRPDFLGTLSEAAQRVSVQVGSFTYEVAESDINNDNLTWRLPGTSLNADVEGNIVAVTVFAEDLAGNVGPSTTKYVKIRWSGYLETFDNESIYYYRDWTFTSTEEGQITFPDGVLLMSDRVDGSLYSLNEAIWEVNLAGHENLRLTFDHRDYADEFDSIPETFTGSVEGDGVSISVDGEHWVKITDLHQSFTGQSFELDSLLVQAGELAESTDLSRVRIKFQQYDDRRYPLDGRHIDNVKIDLISRPEIKVEGKSGVNEGWVEIISGDTTPMSSDGTVFGLIAYNGSPETRYFQITNSGFATMNLDSVVIPDGFVLMSAVPTSLAAQESVVLAIRLPANHWGVFQGNVEIRSNDADEGVFTFKISGEVGDLEASVDAIETNDFTPTITGTVNDPTATLEIAIFQGQVPIFISSPGQVVNNQDGTWTFSGEFLPSELAEQTYFVTVQATNNSLIVNGLGNTLKIETVAPMVSILGIHPIWGEIIVTTTRPSLSGTVDDSTATVRVTVRPRRLDGSSPSDGDGTITMVAITNGSTWTLPGSSFAQELAHGSYEVTVTATDAAGNVSIPIEPPVTLFVDLESLQILDYIIEGDDIEGTRDYLTYVQRPDITFLFSEPVVFNPHNPGEGSWDTPDDWTVMDVVLIADTRGNIIPLESIVGWDPFTQTEVAWGQSDQAVYAIRVRPAQDLVPDNFAGTYLFDVYFENSTVLSRSGQSLNDNALTRRLDIEIIDPEVTLSTQVSSDPSPELTGTTSGGYVEVAVRVDNGEWIKVAQENNKNGVWTLPAGNITPDLTIGEHVIEVRARDIAGNTALITETLTISDIADGFSDGNMDGWVVVDQGSLAGPSAWSVVDGQLVQRSNIHRQESDVDKWVLVNNRYPTWIQGWSRIDNLGTFAVYQDGMAWTNVSVTASLQSSDPDDIGIMFRYQDANNYYRFSMNAATGFQRLVKVENGVVTRLAADIPNGFTLNQVYQVKIVANGTLLEVSLDGQKIFSVVDEPTSSSSPFLSGSVAFYTRANGGAAFDNFSMLNVSGVNVAPRVHIEASQDWMVADQTLELQAKAYDPNAGPQALTYTWYVDSQYGSFDDIHKMNPLFTPTSAALNQSVVVSVTVSDGDLSSPISLFTIDVLDMDAAELLNDSFDNLNGWVVVDQGDQEGPSRWVITNEGVAQQSNIHRSMDGIREQGTFLYHDRGAAWTDYQVDVKMTSHDDDSVGVMFRVQDDNNYYRFSWNKQNGVRRLIKMVNGVATELASDNAMYDTGRTYAVQIVAHGPSLQVLVDGDEIFYEIDQSLSRGTVALYTSENQGGVFDDLVVTNLRNTPLGARVLAPQASSAVIHDQESVQLYVEASDFQGNPLTYAWHSTEGTFDNSSIVNPVFTPYNTVIGSKTVTINVSVDNQVETVTRSIDILVYDNNAVDMLPATDNSSLTNWTVRDATGSLEGPSIWGVENTVIVQRSNIYVPNDGLAQRGTYLKYKNGRAWTDISLETDIWSTDNDSFGVMFRVQDDNNFYRLTWNSELGFRRLEKVVNGTLTVLAQDQVSYDIGREYKLQIFAVGDQLAVFIDGILVFDVDDSSLTSGSIALYSWGNAGSFFDDTRVRDLR